MRKAEQFPGRWIATLHRQLQIYLSKELKAINLTNSEYIYISYLLENGDGVYQEHLVKELFIDKAAITRSISTLEKKGFLIRMDDLVDKRKKRVFLTKEGKNLRKPLFNILDAVEENLSQEISKESLATTTETLKQISKNISR